MKSPDGSLQGKALEPFGQAPCRVGDHRDHGATGSPGGGWQPLEKRRGKRLAKAAQVGPPGRQAGEYRYRKLWRERVEGLKSCLDRPDAAPEPAERARQRHRETAQRVRSRLQAACRFGLQQDALNVRQQARQSGRQKVRQQAEGAMPFRAVPTRDAHALRRYTWITAMACERAAPLWMQGTGRQACRTPFLVRDVSRGGRLCPERKLQRRSPTRRSSSIVRQILCGVRPGLDPMPDPRMSWGLASVTARRLQIKRGSR